MTTTEPQNEAAVAQQPPVLDGEIFLAAQMIFADRLLLAQRYVEHLASSGIVRGLIGPREAPKLWERHVLNCAVVQELIPESSRVADVGSGAGLPGLCLALARPDSHFTLIEPLERRVLWLQEVVSDLQLKNVTIVRTRGEQAKDQMDKVQIVTARAVSALSGLLDITLPLLEPQGELLALKGRSAEDELDKARKQLKKWKVQKTEIVTVGTKLLQQPTTVVRVKL